MASAGDFPDVIREGDPLLGNSYQHYYEGAYYRLLFPDWPRGYDRETEPAVYRISADKTVNARVEDASLREAVRKDYWKKIDAAMAHPLPDGPPIELFERSLREYAKNNPNPPEISFGGLADLAERQQKDFSGMMDGPGMIAPQVRSALLESMEKGSAAEGKAPWTCPSCGKADNTGKFCPECGQAKPVTGEGWTCPKCATEGNKGNFCVGCGARRPE